MNQREKAAHDKAAFLKELHACGDWAKASQRINRPRNTTNGWRRSDVTFRKETEKVLSIWKGTEGVKRCRKCRAVQDISEFAFRSERQSYRSICKGCKKGDIFLLRVFIGFCPLFCLAQMPTAFGETATT
jgi:hypothetical protein